MKNTITLRKNACKAAKTAEENAYESALMEGASESEAKAIGEKAWVNAHNDYYVEYEEYLADKD